MLKKQEEKLLELLDEKIREADIYFREDIDFTDKEVDSYINGLEMAKIIIQEHEYLDCAKRELSKNIVDVFTSTAEELEGTEVDDFLEIYDMNLRAIECSLGSPTQTNFNRYGNKDGSNKMYPIVTTDNVIVGYVIEEYRATGREYNSDLIYYIVNNSKVISRDIIIDGLCFANILSIK